MDSSQLIRLRAAAANLYAARSNLVDATMVTRNNRLKAASQGFIAPYSQSNYMNASCCPPLRIGGAASDYGDSRLDEASFTGTAVNTFANVMDRRAGAAICCGPPAASTLPQGVQLYGDCACSPGPGAPRILLIGVEVGTLVVYFSPPETDGGSFITNYRYSIDNGATFAYTNTTSSPLLITGLTGGQTYQVVIQAVNINEIGTVSNTASVFLPYNTVGITEWAAYVDNSSSDDRNLGLVCDNNNNVYAVGITTPPIGGTSIFDASGVTQSATNYKIAYTNLNTAGQVVKYNSNGKCQWVASMEAADIQLWYAIACDAQNNLFLTGTTTNTATLYDASGFTSVAGNITTPAGRSMPFCKINSDGKWQWATGFASSFTGSEGLYCTVDNNTDIYFSGFYNIVGGTITLSNASGNTQVASSYSLPQTGGGTYQSLIKLNQSGQVQWSLYSINSIADGAIGGLATDSANNVYFGVVYTANINPVDASGFTQSNNTLFTLTKAGARSAALIKYNSNGKVQWCTKVDTTSSNDSRAIAVDSQCNVYWMGMYGSNTTGTYFVQDVSGTTQTNSLITLRQAASAGDSNAFLIKYSPEGKALWATCFGQANQGDIGYKITIDTLNNIYICGNSVAGVKFDLYDASGTTQVLSPFSFTPTTSRGNAGILLKYNSNGIAQWGTFLDAPGTDITYNVAVDKTNSAYVTGGTTGITNLYDVSGNGTVLSPITVGTLAAGNTNAPIVKYR